MATKTKSITDETPEDFEKTSNSNQLSGSSENQNNSNEVVVPKKGDLFDITKLTFEKAKYKMGYPSAEARNRGVIPRDTALQILEKFKMFSSSNDNEMTFRAFALLIQEGGANRSKNNIKIYLGGKEFSLELLKMAIKSSVEYNVTVRQLARTSNDEILKIALADNMRGPLVNELLKIQDNDLQIKENEFPFCNEIFMNNEKLPGNIKTLLQKREEALKEKNVQNISKQQTVPRRRRNK